MGKRVNKFLVYSLLAGMVQCGVSASIVYAAPINNEQQQEQQLREQQQQQQQR